MEVVPKQPQIPPSSAWSTPLTFSDRDHAQVRPPPAPRSTRPPNPAQPHPHPHQSPPSLPTSAALPSPPPLNPSASIPLAHLPSDSPLPPNVPSHPSHPSHSAASIFDMPKRSLPHPHHSLVRSESAPLDLFDHSFTADFNNLSLASSPDLDPFSIPRPINLSRHAHHPSSSLSSSPSHNNLSLPSQRKPPHPSNNSNNLNPNINNPNNNLTSSNSFNSNKPLASRSVSSIELAEIVNASRNRNPFPPRLSPVKPLTSKPLSSTTQNASAHHKSARPDLSVFDMIQNDFPETPAPALPSLPSSTRQSAMAPNPSAHRASTHVKPVAHRRSRLASTASLDLDLNRLAIGDPTEQPGNPPNEPPSLNHNELFRPLNAPIPRHRRSVSVNWTGNLESLADEIPRSASRPNLLNSTDHASSLFANTSDQLLHSSSGLTSQTSSAVTKSESTSPEPNTPVATATSSHAALSAPIPSSAAVAVPTSQAHLSTVNSSFSTRPQAVAQKSFQSSAAPDSRLPRVDDLSFPTLQDYEHLYQEPREAPVPGLSANVQPGNHTYAQAGSAVARFPATQSDLLGGSSHMQQVQGNTDYGSLFNGVGLFPSPFSNTNMGVGAAATPTYSDTYHEGLAAADNLKNNIGMQMAAFLNAQQQLYAAHVAHMAALTGNTVLNNPNAFSGLSNPFNHLGNSGHSTHLRTPWDTPGAAHRAAPRGKHHYDQHRGGNTHSGNKKSNSMEQNHKSRNGRNRRNHRSQDEVSFASGQKSNERVGMGSSVVGGTIQDSTHNRSPLLEEFRATSNSIGRGFGSMSDLTMSGAYGNLGHVPNGREWQLSEIKNNVVEFATDQHGSRFIQQKLETATQEEKDSILKQALTDAQRLMTDVFGNYVVQKLLEHGGHNAVKLIAGELEGRMLVLSLHMYGCRVVQKALEVLNPAARAVLVRELNGHVLKCIRDQNGNHVIQKCVELVEPESVQFVVDAVLGQAVILAGHSYGCRVVQRILEHGAPKQKAPIMSEIMSSIPDLIKDQYGNYVIQHVVEHGTVAERSVIMKLVVAEVCQLSQHKFASNVVERCLQFGSLKEQEILIEILIVGEGGGSASPLTHLVRDQFGNYVVQRVLDVALTPQRERVVSILRAQVPAIKKYSYGKHIIARLEGHQSASTASFTSGHTVHPSSGNVGSVSRVERSVGPSVVSVGTSQGLPSSSHSYFYYD